MASIKITAPDGTGAFDCFVVQPKRPAAGVVVLIQEIFGVNQSMRDTCAYVADLGFIALAPDLFWRQQPGVDITDKTKAEWDQAFALMNGFDQAKGIEDLVATVEVARGMPGSNGKVATMGYCLGGRLAAMMAVHSDADVNVSYYGVGLDSLIEQFGAVKSPLLIHIAGEDAFFPAEGRAKVAAAAEGHPAIRTFTYNGADHAFARVGGTHWDGRSAAIANGRSAEALVAALG